ncbi:MAG: hypothetical protein HDR23_10015 [Lachnospiraceae bacterium]|nr:hypothetical protein [Lachnospiraceae bacterium]
MKIDEKEEVKEKERPWLEDKRSWVFYIADIKKNENMVYGETGDSVFVLDCTTAHLLIWSKKWEVFTEVGISNLLKRVSSIWSESNKAALEGTRVFYKGIELRNRCLADDTELLEYIDIKGGLDRKHININRNGFTEEGERFFEEKLYPGLLEVIQKVLKELGRNASKTGFGFKINNVVKNMCNEIIADNLVDEEQKIAKRQDLISLIGNVAVLAYLAMRDEWNIWEKLQREHLQNKAWRDLLKNLDETLHDAKNRQLIQELGTMTALFNIETYTSKHRLKVGRGERNQKENDVNFLKIFLQDNHWAILQWRRNQHSTWVSYLISLEKEVELFQKLISIPQSEKDENELERWGINLCNLSNTIQPDGEPEMMLDYKQQVLLKWMLKNIPTIGLFCNEQGNVRVNVLSGRIYPSIYMNKNFKCLILERMMEKAKEDNIQRFSTMTWQGRESISCNQLPFAVYFIKRGYLSDYSYHKSIIPLEGSLLSRWKQALDDLVNSELTQKVDRLLEDMNIVGCLQRFQQEEREDGYEEVREYLRESETNAILEISTMFFDVILKEIVEHKFERPNSIEELLELNEERSVKWRKVYYIVAKIYVLGMKDKLDENESKKLRKELWEDDGIDSLCSAWLYCCLFRDGIVHGRSAIRKQYKDYYVDFQDEITNKKDKIAEYISKVGYCTDLDTIKANIAEYEDELLDLATELEMRQIKKYLDENTRSYKFFTQKLMEEYIEYSSQ